MGVRLTFALNTGKNRVAAHIQFLSEAGRLFRSLEVDDFQTIPGINGEASESIDRLFDILRLCPLSEELTISFASSLLASHCKSKYPSLKKLSIIGVKSLIFLNSLTSNLPNLRELHLRIDHTQVKRTNSIFIGMPHASLDSLTWYDDASDTEAYIKLNTMKGLKYYFGHIHLLLPVDESRYLLATQNDRFDIICKDLKEFRRRGYLSHRHYNWVF
ncbi:hypothetical protein MFLAVUS_001644 [Mucor flavus]|uniref:Uncharacterized protein n=1 Tax=Mucor flavus TaxID=439312 RepID=A0ABP9YN16_9FUNG